MYLKFFSPFLSFIIFIFFSPHLHAQNRTGLDFLDESQYRSIPLASTPLLGNLPKEVDLSSYFPEPGNQGQQSSCVGWAVSYLKAYQENVERKWSLADRNHNFSPAYIYNQIKTSPSCQGGSNFSDALNLVRKSGAATLADFPYDESQCAKMPDAYVNQRARDYAIADWRRVNPQDETEIKTQVAAGFPVLIGMIVDDKFSRMSSGDVYAGPPGRNLGGHAMVVVGYSDESETFTVINSWGIEWGDEGFGKISYRSFRSTVREAFVAQDIVVTPAPGPSPAPDPSPTPSPPRPRPAPSPVAEAVIDMGAPNFLHNSMVSTPTGLQPGMQIRVPGTVKNAAGRSLQLLVKFNYMNGPPLRAHPAEALFRDSGGLAATGTAPIPVATNFENLDSITLGMPYYALNMQPTGGFNNYQLSFTVVAVIDNQPKAQSHPVPFPFRW